MSKNYQAFTIPTEATVVKYGLKNPRILQHAVCEIAQYPEDGEKACQNICDECLFDYDRIETLAPFTEWAKDGGLI